MKYSNLLNIKNKINILLRIEIIAVYEEESFLYNDDVSLSAVAV